MMGTLAFSLVAVAAKGTAILAVLWLAHRALAGRHPALRMALWRAGAVALLVLPVVDLVAPRWESRALAPVIQPVAVVARRAAAPVETSVAAIPGGSASFPVGGLLLAVWGVGALVLATRHMAGARSLSRLLAVAEPAPRELVQKADTIARDLGRPLDFELRLVPDGRSPFLGGIRRPVVGIPRQFADSPRELAAVLAHELTHRAGSDHRWASVIECARVLWWPHPLAWWIGAAHRSACEENSDAVAARYDGDRSWYSALLARMALETAGNPPTLAISMLNGSEIMARLRRLAHADTRRPLASGARGSIAALALGLALVIGTVAISPGSSRAASPRADFIEAPSAMVQRLTARGADEDRKAALAEIRADLESEDPSRVGPALAALRETYEHKLDRAGMLEPARQALSSESAAVRRLAVTVLPILGANREDLPLLAALAEDSDPSVLEALGNSLFFYEPSAGLLPERDAILLRLLAHPDDTTKREALRGSWGNPVGPEVEARMIELSRLPTMRYDAIYFALSTRPEKSLAVAQRLVEILHEPAEADERPRALWGLTHYPAVPEARAMIHAELVARYAETNSLSGRSEILFYFGGVGCELSKEILQQIAADEAESESLRKQAREYLERGC